MNKIFHAKTQRSRRKDAENLRAFAKPWRLCVKYQMSEEQNAEECDAMDDDKNFLSWLHK